METAGAGAETVVREFLDHRFDADLEGERLAQADEDFFADLVRGAVASQAEIDRAIARHLASGWRLERLDATARAIFRAGAFELMRTEAPIEVVIDEYVDVAKAFFEGEVPAMVNAVLDTLARKLRPAEFT
jgi:N utilization substance protein B